MTRIRFDESLPKSGRWWVVSATAAVVVGGVAALLLWTSLNGRSDAGSKLEVPASTVIGDRVWAMAADVPPDPPPGLRRAVSEDATCDDRDGDLSVDAKSAGSSTASAP